MKKQVAIIGGGIVGATAAYFLSKEDNIELIVFDDGKGQATKAAAGIISPWFSQRRNKPWLRLVASGAAFYPDLVKDLESNGQIVKSYRQNGVLITQKTEKKLYKVYEQAKISQKLFPTMGEISLLSSKEASQKFPLINFEEEVFYASGGALVDGALLVQELKEASKKNGVRWVNERVNLDKIDKETVHINGKNYDQVILATGAWLKDILKPHGYQVDIRGQKGQLIEIYLDKLVNNNYSVFMPEGELDLMPFSDGRLAVGASHEDDQAFNLEPDLKVQEKLLAEARSWLKDSYPDLENWQSRIGTRAYTSDYAPFFGPLPKSEHLLVASGLGSTGLTAGPIIGKLLAEILIHENPHFMLGKKEPNQDIGWLEASDYLPENYIRGLKKRV